MESENIADEARLERARLERKMKIHELVSKGYGYGLSKGDASDPSSTSSSSVASEDSLTHTVALVTTTVAPFSDSDPKSSTSSQRAHPIDASRSFEMLHDAESAMARGGPGGDHNSFDSTQTVTKTTKAPAESLADSPQSIPASVDSAFTKTGVLKAATGAEAAPPPGAVDVDAGFVQTADAGGNQGSALLNQDGIVGAPGDRGNGQSNSAAAAAADSMPLTQATTPLSSAPLTPGWISQGALGVTPHQGVGGHSAPPTEIHTAAIKTGGEVNFNEKTEFDAPPIRSDGPPKGVQTGAFTHGGDAASLSAAHSATAASTREGVPTASTPGRSMEGTHHRPLELGPASAGDASGIALDTVGAAQQPPHSIPESVNVGSKTGRAQKRDGLRHMPLISPGYNYQTGFQSGPDPPTQVAPLARASAVSSGAPEAPL